MHTSRVSRSSWCCFSSSPVHEVQICLRVFSPLELPPIAVAQACLWLCVGATSCSWHVLLSNLRLRLLLLDWPATLLRVALAGDSSSFLVTYGSWDFLFPIMAQLSQRGSEFTSLGSAIWVMGKMHIISFHKKSSRYHHTLESFVLLLLSSSFPSVCLRTKYFPKGGNWILFEPGNFFPVLFFCNSSCSRTASFAVYRSTWRFLQCCECTHVMV